MFFSRVLQPSWETGVTFLLHHAFIPEKREAALTNEVSDIRVKGENYFLFSVCQPYANPLHIILGIIAAIVGIGLAILLIWKLLTSIKDAREFKNFQKESQNPRWQGVRLGIKSHFNLSVKYKNVFSLKLI